MFFTCFHRILFFFNLKMKFVYVSFNFPIHFFPSCINFIWAPWTVHIPLQIAFSFFTSSLSAPFCFIRMLLILLWKLEYKKQFLYNFQFDVFIDIIRNVENKAVLNSHKKYIFTLRFSFHRNTTNIQHW